MSLSPSRLALLAWVPLLPLALPCPALAQDAAPLTAEQSASLDRAISLWTAGLSGTSKGAALPYTVAPEGDHYILTTPLPKQIGKTGITLSGADLVAHARPLDGGRWAFDNVHGFSPLTLVTPKGEDGKQLRLSLTLADQDGQAVIDPSLATTSSFDSKSGALAANVQIGDGSSSIHADHTTSHAGWQPAGSGRVNVSQTGDMQGLAYEIAGPKQAKATAHIRTVHTESHMTGFDPQRMAALVGLSLDVLRAIPELATGGTGHAKSPDVTKTGDAQPGPAATPGKAEPKAAAAPAKPQLTAAQRAALHKLLDDVRGLYTSTDDTMALVGIDVLAQGHHVTLDKATFSQAFAAPDGKVDAHMRMAFEGLTSPDIPPAIAQDFVPHRLVIAPRVSGLSVDAVFDALGRAIDDAQPKPDEMKTHAADMLAKSPVTAGLDELSFDIGPALFTASGSVKMAGPTAQDVTGSAVIEAHGLNALIKRANTDPLVKQAAPVLIFLKGIGDADQSGSVVWKVTYGEGKVLVNGTDLSQLVPHK